MRLLIVFFILYSITLNAKTIEVCPTCEINTISDGVALALEGDTVLVKKGVYKELDIQISKGIHVVGVDNPIIDGENQKGNIFSVQSDNFSISGFTLRNLTHSYTKEFAAIFVSNSKYFELKDNVLENIFFGIIVQRSKYGLLKSNSILGDAENESDSGNGIHIWHSSHMRVEQNTVIGLRDGIYFEFVNKSSISNNVSKQNIRYGLHFMFSNNNEYHHNEFKNNGAGVAVMFSKFINMHHNTFHYNWGTASYGLLLKEINDAEIRNNYFEKNTIGINVDGCNRINYNNNNFVRNGWAIRFNGGCYENIFEFNNFLHNTFDLSYSSKLNSNKFEGNYWSEYSGYDIGKDGIGDVPHRPVKLFSYIVSKTPESLILIRSLFIDIINFSEKVSPVFTPSDLMDNKPIMHKINDNN